MKIESMTSYRVVKPVDSRKRAGQRDLPDHFEFKQGSDVKSLPWGTVVEAREACEYPFEFSTEEQKYLAHVDFIKSHQKLFNLL